MKRFPTGSRASRSSRSTSRRTLPTGCRSVDVPANDGKDASPTPWSTTCRRWPGRPTSGPSSSTCRCGTSAGTASCPLGPDFMVFDLDPGEGTSIVECCVVAGYVMDELDKDGPGALRQDERVQGTPALRGGGAEDDLGRRAEPCLRHRPQAGDGAPRPRGLQHAQVAAPGPGPHRLEPEPPGQDHRRRVLGAGHAHADGLDAGHAEPRCTGAPARRTRTLLRFETDDVLRRVETDGDLFAPLGLSCTLKRSAVPHD